VGTVDPAIECKRSPLAVVARIAGPQHGVVARPQLLAAGVPRRAVDHLVAAGSLVPLYRGVYGAGHRPVGPRSREMAVALLARGPVGRQSALGLWAMSRPWRGPVHAIGAKARKGEGYVIHRTNHLPPEDVTIHWGIPVTTPLRTLLDLSGTLPLDALDAALAEALVRKLVTIEALQPRATGDLAKLVDTAAPTRSKLERDLRRLLREHGLPQPISNGFVCGYEVDLHWPELKLVAELDGYEFHHPRRAFETDRERDIVLAANGHRTVRVTNRQLTGQRHETAERFQALLTLPGAVDVRRRSRGLSEHPPPDPDHPPTRGVGA
jgi:very-short-patch-repair endonuclease